MLKRCTGPTTAHNRTASSVRLQHLTYLPVPQVVSGYSVCVLAGDTAPLSLLLASKGLAGAKRRQDDGGGRHDAPLLCLFQGSSWLLHGVMSGLSIYPPPAPNSIRSTEKS